jgi:hypothetical protein
MLVTVALLPLVGACGSDETEGPAVVYDACQSTLLVPGADVTASERESLGDALALWRDVAGPGLSVTDTQLTQVLPIGFQSAAPSFFGLYRPDRGDILINRELSDRHARAITMAHEIGHAFGLAHVTGHRSLMNPGNLQVPPAAEDTQLIYQRRPACAAK